jgi:hypothetical protein
MTEAWIQILTLIGSNIVFTLTLWLWNRSESRADIRTMMNMMHDFHGRLERQDAEFKSHIRYANHGAKEGK